MIILNESADFLTLLSEFAVQVLPVVGVVVLVLLAKIFLELLKVVRGLDTTVDKVNHTLDGVDRSMDKLQAPLNTVENLSYTVDNVHEFTKNSFVKSVGLVNENLDFLKDWAGSLFKKDKEPEVKDDLEV